MKVALAIWNGRISPVFDASERILVLEIKDGKIMAQREELIGESDSLRRVRRLVDLSIEALICGAISRSLAGLISAYGIRVLPFIAGEVDEVLMAYLAGTLPNPSMTMPGCFQRCQRFRRGWNREKHMNHKNQANN